MPFKDDNSARLVTEPMGEFQTYIKSILHEDVPLAILKTDQNEHMRLFALCYDIPCVVRMRSCLECCFAVAKGCGITYHRVLAP